MKNSYLKKILFLLLLVSTSIETYAQKITNYTSSDGLVNGIIYSIIEDHNNDFWFGTWSNAEGVSGLGKFDGTNWQQFTTADGTVSDKVQKLFEDSNNNLWVGSFDSGLSKFDGISWTTYTTADGLAGNSVSSIIEDTNGNLWFGTRGGGVSKFDGITTWTNYTTTDGLIDNDVSSIIQDSAGNFWFGTFNAGVSKFDGTTTWTSYTDADGLAHNQIYTMMEGNNNEFWFGNYADAGLSQFNANTNTWSIFTTDDGFLENRHRAMLKDNQGNLWFGGNAGVSMFDGENLFSFTTADGILGNRIREIMQDSQDRIWIGTWLSNGVSVIDFSLVPIPDPNFEMALIDLGIDTNGLTGDILRTDAEAITELNVNDRNINSIQGIEAFANLEILYCQRNQLTSIDVSKNLALTNLECESNQFSTLDLSKNVALKVLGCSDNNLTSLDVSKNLSLEAIWCPNNDIQSLNLELNTALKVYGLFGNPLTSLSIKNGNNANMAYIDAHDLPNLTCMTVDDESASYLANWNVDPDVSFSNDCGDFVYIPDTNFEQALIYLGIDSDGVVNTSILRSDAEAKTGQLDVNDKNISDLTGLEAFVNLDELNASKNDISNINTSSNTLLTSLTLQDCLNLNSIDVSNNINLLNLDIGRSRISGTIDTQNLINLEYLYLQANLDITTLDLTNNTKLKVIWASFNQLSNLDLSKNLDLKELWIHNNSVNIIDVSENILLEKLSVRNNGISNLDLFNNTQLNRLDCNGNNLISLDLSNQPIEILRAYDNILLEHLDMRNGNNLNVTGLFLDNTPNLTCINADGIGIPDISEIMVASGKAFSPDCSDIVLIPDANFEQALINLGIDTNGLTGGILRSDAEAVVVLDVSNKNISDLTGVEAFINLENFNCRLNQLSNLDVTANTKLLELDCSRNQLNLIDITKNTALTLFYFSNNNISEVDVSKNVNLERIAGSFNPLSSIDISKNTSLIYFSFIYVPLESVDLSKNVNLKYFFSIQASFTTIDLSNNPQLIQLYISDNPNLKHLDVRNGNNNNILQFIVDNTPNLTCVNADGVGAPNISQAMIDSGKTFSEDCGDFVYIPDPNFEQALIDLGIDSDGVVNTSILKDDAEAQTGHLGVCCRDISDLTGVEAFVNITELQAGDNLLTEIDVSQNTELIKIWVYSNQLISLDLSNNTKMQRISAGGNQLTSVDFSNLVDVHTIYLWQNQLATIDVSGLPILDRLDVSDNLLSTIDISSNTQLTWSRMYNNKLTQLDISLNQQLNWLEAQYNLGLKLITVPITGSPSLTGLDLSGTGLSNFNPTLYPNLEILWLNENSISKFNTNNIPNLKALVMNDNQLGDLDLSSNTLLQEVQLNNNLLTDLDMRNGNNMAIGRFKTLGNLLTCISVDNPDDTTIPYNTWEIDLGVILSLDCKGEPEVVLIPDSNFEAALATYDTNGMNGNILLSDAEAITDLNVSNNNILDLTGIEAFVNLTNLNVSNNLLNSIHLIENTNLVNLDVSGNGLSELTVYSDRNLISINASNNLLVSIDLSNHDNLETLDASSNLLSVLDLRNSAALVVMDASNNPNLMCIGVIDMTTIPSGWIKDASASYSNNPDCVSPTIVGKDVTINLGIRGEATVIARAFDNGSTDNVTLNENLVFAVSKASFNCSNLGLNNITLTVTDEAGNSSSMLVQLMVRDVTPPKLVAVNSFSYDLKGMSAYNLSPSSLLRSTSDNCGTTTLSVSPSVFTAPGTYSVTLSSEDNSGNNTSVNTTVIITNSLATSKLRFKRNLELTVYPVPFSDFINITFSKPTDLNTVSVVLFNFNMAPTGIVFSPNSGNLISNYTGALPTGTYILQVTVSGETKTTQIIKN